MRPFRFRAERALELRRKLEDEARLVVVRAQNTAAMADARLETAQREEHDAGAQLVEVQAQGAPAWLIGWHRSWILKKSRETAICQQHAATAHGVVQQAATVLQDAHKKRRVLERLRERLAARHARESERQDLAHMNELAMTRYLVTATERKEQP